MKALTTHLHDSFLRRGHVLLANHRWSVVHDAHRYHCPPNVVWVNGTNRSLEPIRTGSPETTVNRDWAILAVLCHSVKQPPLRELRSFSATRLRGLARAT